jgi:hypothetical protein
MKSAAIRDSRIDFKPDFAVFHDETDHHALRSGIASISHGENTKLLLNRKSRVDLFVGPGTDKQDMTSSGLPAFGDAADVHRPRANSLAGHHIVQGAAKRIVTENADREGFSRVPKGPVRPDDELCEVRPPARLDRRREPLQAPASDRPQRPGHSFCSASSLSGFEAWAGCAPLRSATRFFQRRCGQLPCQSPLLNFHIRESAI